jgi:membrane-associated phospholipid phosphatase
VGYGAAGRATDARRPEGGVAVSLLPRALDDPARRGRLRGGIILERNPFEPPILTRGVIAGVVLALVVAAMGWPLTAATPVDAEVEVVTGLTIGGAGVLSVIALVLSYAGHLLPVAFVAAVAALVARWRWGGWDLGLLLLTVLGGASVITGTIKLLTSRTRPEEAVVETLSSAFPSGHAVRAAAVYGLIAWLVLQITRRRWLRVVLVALVVGAITLNAYARIALAAHWPSDVLVGVALGAAWLAVSLWLLRPRPLAVARLRADEG